MVPYKLHLVQFWSNSNFFLGHILNNPKRFSFATTIFHSVVVIIPGRLSRDSWFVSHPRQFLSSLLQIYLPAAKTVLNSVGLMVSYSYAEPIHVLIPLKSHKLNSINYVIHDYPLYSVCIDRHHRETVKVTIYCL